MEGGVFCKILKTHTEFTEYSGAYSPDGNEYYFYRFSENSRSRLLFSKVVDGKWTEPEELAFSVGYGAFEPYVTFDNKKIYFNWNHSVPLGHPSGLPVYFLLKEHKMVGQNQNMLVKVCL